MKKLFLLALLIPFGVQAQEAPPTMEGRAQDGSTITVYQQPDGTWVNAEGLGICDCFIDPTLGGHTCDGDPTPACGDGWWGNCHGYVHDDISDHGHLECDGEVATTVPEGIRSPSQCSAKASLFERLASR